MEWEEDRETTPQVQEAMEVISFDGKLLGYVTSVRKKDFRVHRFIAPDIYLSFSFIESISENRIHLNLAEHEIAMTGWPHHGRKILASVPHPHSPKGR